MGYGEVGKLLLQVTIDKRMINYLIRLFKKTVAYYLSIIYTITLKLLISGEYKTQWLRRVKGILDNCGLSYIWLNQNRIDKIQCKYFKMAMVMVRNDKYDFWPNFGTRQQTARQWDVDGAYSGTVIEPTVGR